MGSTDRLDRLHIESVGKGENKYSTLQKVGRLYFMQNLSLPVYLLIELLCVLSFSSNLDYC